jgi:hypothetical protein
MVRKPGGLPCLNLKSLCNILKAKDSSTKLEREKSFAFMRVQEYCLVSFPLVVQPEVRKLDYKRINICLNLKV